jgi:Rps23 Pro-64 3,4-dihydroxylase Tpa1-like proline 4-hydroxylase
MHRRMINFERFSSELLALEPYRWAFVDRLFSTSDAADLVETFPRDHFKTVKGYDGEKGYQYEARSLVMMGANVASQSEFLTPSWRRLADDLVSTDYREAMSLLTGMDLRDLPLEINIFHYGRSAWLGPHVDLPDKLVTHVLYFNDSWNERDGGCLTILRSPNMNDTEKVILPLIGNSAVLVRSDNSWHAVTRVREECRSSRRSMAVTFYRPGSPSTMWPAGDTAKLHTYRENGSGLLGWLKRKVSD